MSLFDGSPRWAGRLFEKTFDQSRRHSSVFLSELSPDLVRGLFLAQLEGLILSQLRGDICAGVASYHKTEGDEEVPNERGAEESVATIMRHGAQCGLKAM